MDEEVQRFIDSVPYDRRPLFGRLRTMIERLFPDASVKLSYGVPTYKIESGWVALGYWRGGVSLYTNGSHHLSGFKRENPGVRTGTGVINLKLSDPVPEESLTRVIRHAMEGRKEAW